LGRLSQREIASVDRNFGEGQSGFARAQLKTVPTTVVGKGPVAAQFVRRRKIRAKMLWIGEIDCSFHFRCGGVVQFYLE